MTENFLKKAREKQNITPSQLAKLTGVKRQNIWAWENGKFGISKENLKKIADVLRVSVDYIISGKVEDSFDGKSKERLSKSMLLADEFYGNQLTKSDAVEVATEIYDLLSTIESIDNENERKEFLKSLKSQYISGLAANCIINLEPK
jgi:transcriptional regulator with XRE-family HTH domain